MFFTSILVFLFVGFFTGVIAGLLGVGGGMILVPFQVFIYNLIDIPYDMQIKLAVATSLATIVFYTLIASRSQAKRGAISWALVYKISTGIIFGAITGVYIARVLPSKGLEVLFGSIQIAVGVYFLLFKRLHEQKEFTHLNFLPLNIIGATIGAIATMLGTGGGFLTVPVLVFLGMPIRQAIGSSSAIAFLLSVIGSLTFILPAFEGHSFPYSLGYIYLPAFIPLTIAGIFAAPLGVRLAHTVPTQILKKIFSSGLIIIGFYMILR